MISIIIPIYKVEKYLKKCVDSVIAQTYKDIEIILVDDGSPDGCPAICDEYAKKDSRIKVVHKTNGGLLNARKTGLEHASGEYIGFVDGDDWIENYVYADFAEMIKKYSPDMVLSDFYYDGANGKSESSEQLFEREFYNKKALEEELYPKMLFSGEYYKFGVNPCCWSKVYKKELLQKNLEQSDGRIKMGEDAAFTYPCLMDAQSAAAVTRAGYHYIMNPQSMTKAYDKGLKDIIFLPYERIMEKGCECGVDISGQADYYLIYLANFLLRNEIAGKSEKECSRALAENAAVTTAAARIDFKKLPLHTKLFAAALKQKSAFLINMYAKILKQAI